MVQRAMLDNQAVCQRTSHMFLFGTPSAALVKAGPFSFLKRRTRDLTENSDFILDLRTRWTTRFGTAPPFRCFRVIAGDQDEFVPSASSLNPFPSDQRFCPSMKPPANRKAVQRRKPIGTGGIGWNPESSHAGRTSHGGTLGHRIAPVSESGGHSTPARRFPGR